MQDSERAPLAGPKKHICIFVARTREALHTSNGDTSFVPKEIASALQILFKWIRKDETVLACQMADWLACWLSFLAGGWGQLAA